MRVSDKDKSLVLSALCRQVVSIMYCGYPIPSTFLSEYLNLSLYKTRKILKQLKNDGLVYSKTVCELTEYENLIYKGYLLTESGVHTSEYRDAIKDENELCKKVFGHEVYDESYFKSI